MKWFIYLNCGCRSKWRMIIAVNSNCLNWKIYCDDHSSLWSTTAVQIYESFHINVTSITFVVHQLCRCGIYLVGWIMSQIRTAQASEHAWSERRRYASSLWLPLCVVACLAFEGYCLLQSNRSGEPMALQCVGHIDKTVETVECLRVTRSWQPYCKTILWKCNSFLMQTLSFVPRNLHGCRPIWSKRPNLSNPVEESHVCFQLNSVE